MLEELLSLLNRLVEAQETIAKNSSNGKPVTADALAEVAKSGSTKKESKPAAKKESKPVEKKVEKKVEKEVEPKVKDTPKAETKAKQPAKDADEVVEPTKEELVSAQLFKKELLAVGRGHDNYIERLKSVLGKHKAENVPVDMREELIDAAKAEFNDETDEI